jgi:hypothetical protein
MRVSAPVQSGMTAFGLFGDIKLRDPLWFCPNRRHNRPPGSNRRKTQQPLESSTIFEPVVIVVRLLFFVPLYLLT